MYCNLYLQFSYNNLYRGRRLETIITEISNGNTKEQLSKQTKGAGYTLLEHTCFYSQNMHQVSVTHLLSLGLDTFLAQRVTILTGSMKMHPLISELRHKYTKSLFHWFMRTHTEQRKEIHHFRPGKTFLNHKGLENGFRVLTLSHKFNPQSSTKLFIFISIHQLALSLQYKSQIILGLVSNVVLSHTKYNFFFLPNK